MDTEKKTTDDLSNMIAREADREPTRFFIGAEERPGISKLQEEAGEVSQVCGKLIGSEGDVLHWDGTNLKERLEDECADLYAAISFVIAECKLDKDRIGFRIGQKLRRFGQWHAERRKSGTRRPAGT